MTYHHKWRVTVIDRASELVGVEFFNSKKEVNSFLANYGITEPETRHFSASGEYELVVRRVY